MVVLLEQSLYFLGFTGKEVCLDSQSHAAKEVHSGDSYARKNAWRHSTDVLTATQI